MSTKPQLTTQEHQLAYGGERRRNQEDLEEEITGAETHNKPPSPMERLDPTGKRGGDVKKRHEHHLKPDLHLG